MTKKKTPYTDADVNALNEKILQSQMFTPDQCYIELGLLKDIPLGILYADKIFIENNEDAFNKMQKHIFSIVKEYQDRVYDTVHPYFDELGYTDDILDDKLKQYEYHDAYFIAAPSTNFIKTLYIHILRNQNHSKPANKYKKKPIQGNKYVLEAIPVTFIINTFPLFIDAELLKDVGKEIGETFGVNVKFMFKDPSTFDNDDWDTWLKDTDCFYFESLGRFTKSAIVMKKQEDMEFIGKYFYARKRFERSVIQIMKKENFEHQIQMVTANLDFFCEFNWLRNNQACLVETETEEDKIDKSE